MPSLPVSSHSSRIWGFQHGLINTNLIWVNKSPSCEKWEANIFISLSFIFLPVQRLMWRMLGTCHFSVAVPSLNTRPQAGSHLSLRSIPLAVTRPPLQAPADNSCFWCTNLRWENLLWTFSCFQGVCLRAHTVNPTHQAFVPHSSGICTTPYDTGDFYSQIPLQSLPAPTV